MQSRRTKIAAGAVFIALAIGTGSAVAQARSFPSSVTGSQLRIVSGATSLSGSAMVLGGNSTVRTRLASEVPSTLKLSVHADLLDGGPTLNVSVDGQQELSKAITNTSAVTVDVPGTLAAGSHSISIAMTGDYYIANRGDRNLYIDSVSLTPTTVLATATTVTTVATPQTSSNKGVFASTSFWDAPIPSNVKYLHSTASADPDASDLLRQVNSFGTTANWNAYSEYFYTVPANQPLVKVIVNGQSSSSTLSTAFNPSTLNGNGVPIPSDAVAPPGTDGSIVIYQPDYNNGAGRVYEMWQFVPASKSSDGVAHASWGGRMSNLSTSVGHPINTGSNPFSLASYEETGWLAAATSLPKLGSTVRISELENGTIPHAFGVQLKQMSGYKWPAQRQDSNGNSGSAIFEGERFQLDPSYQIDPSLPKTVKALMQASKTYGVVVTDRASNVSSQFEIAKQSDYVNGENPYNGSNGILGGRSADDVMKQFWTLSAPHMRALAVGSDANPNPTN